MKKNTKSFVLLCSAACLFTLALAGCKKSSSGGGTADVTHTVAFNSHGGSEVPSQKVKDGEKAKAPTAPTKASDATYNYTFDAWYEEEALVTPFDFNTPITADWTLHAGWNATPKGDTPTPTPSGGGTSTLPEDAPYYVSIGTHMYAFEESLDSTLLETQTAEFVASVGSVTAGDSLSILDSNKEALVDNFGAEPGDTNNVEGEANPFTIRSSAANVMIYLKTWESGWTNFYVTGYQGGGQGSGSVTPPVVEASYGILVNGEDYHAGVAAGKDYQNRDQYAVDGLELKAGDTFVIYDAANEASWIETGDGIDQWSFGSEGDGANIPLYITVGETEYTAVQDFVTNIFIKLAWEDNSIYFGLAGEGGGQGGDVTPPVVESGYGILVNGEDYHAGVAAGQDYQNRDQYKIDGLEFKAGDTFAIYDAENKASWIETGEGIDQWSFGSEGDGANIATYISIGETEYTALLDFVADIFIKIAWEDNSIYFGLAA